MKQRLILVIATVGLSACATQGGQFLEGKPPADVQQQSRDTQKIANYFNKLNPSNKRVLAAERTTLAKAIAKYAPAEYRVYVSPEVDLSTPVVYNPGSQWIDALGAALENEKIELSVNVSKKNLIVKPLKTTIAEVLEKYVPSDYKAYADQNVNLDAYITYDNSCQWFESLGETLADKGIEMTANLNKKLMLLRQIYIEDDAEKQQAAPAPRETQGLELFRAPINK